MALVILICPECGKNQWGMHDLNDFTYQCSHCNKWISDEDMVHESIDAVIEY